MLKTIRPTWRAQKVEDVSVDFLLNNGIKILFVDFDNTMISINQKELSESITDWIDVIITNGVRIRIITNNYSGRVAKRIIKYSDVITHSGFSMKPMPHQIIRQLSSFDINYNQALMIGDGLLTDILAANLVGIKSVLVKPLEDSSKVINILNNTRNIFIDKIYKNSEWL